MGQAQQPHRAKVAAQDLATSCCGRGEFAATVLSKAGQSTRALHNIKSAANEFTRSCTTMKAAVAMSAPRVFPGYVCSRPWFGATFHFHWAFSWS